MTMRFAGLALAAGLVLLLAVGASACTDGGGALTLEEYFQKLDELDNDLQTESDALEAQLDALGEAATVGDARDLFGQQIDIIDAFGEDLGGIDPPGEAAAAHDEAVDAVRDLATEFRSAFDETADATSVDDFFSSFFDDPELDAADTRLTEACLDLEQIAADNNITVDLDCEEDAGDGDGTDGGGNETPSGDGTDGADGALEEYFQQFDVLENEFRVTSNAADAAISALDDTSTVADAVAILEDVVAAIDEFVAGAEDLDPPEEVAVAHAEAVAGFQFVSGFVGDAIENAGDAATVAEFFAFLDDPEFVSADQSLDGVCRALQGIADANGIDVDLGCPEA